MGLGCPNKCQFFTIAAVISQQDMGPLEGLTSDSDVPKVVMDLKDRMVMLKPVDWEVQDDNMEPLSCKI